MTQPSIIHPMPRQPGEPSPRVVDRVVLASEHLRLIADSLDQHVLVELCDEVHGIGGRCALDPPHVGRHVTRAGRHHGLAEEAERKASAVWWKSP